MFESQVLHVDTQITDVGEQLRKLAGTVVNDNKDVREVCAAPVLARDSGNTGITGGQERRECGGGSAAPLPPKKAKLSYKDQRDYDLLPSHIEDLQAAITRDETALSDAALYTRDPAKFAALTAAIAKARADKDAAEERWLELAELVEG